MYTPKHKLFVYGTPDNYIVVDAARAFDAREEARKQLGLNTYDGLDLQEQPKRLRKVYVIDYVGSGMNHTLERIVTKVSV